MKLPTKEWETVENWAKRSGTSEIEALDFAFSHDECELRGIAPRLVRWSPHTIVKPLWKKVSKSDQP